MRRLDARRPGRLLTELVGEALTWLLAAPLPSVAWAGDRTYGNTDVDTMSDGVDTAGAASAGTPPDRPSPSAFAEIQTSDGA